MVVMMFTGAANVVLIESTFALFAKFLDVLLHHLFLYAKLW